VNVHLRPSALLNKLKPCQILVRIRQCYPDLGRDEEGESDKVLIARATFCCVRSARGRRGCEGKGLLSKQLGNAAGVYQKAIAIIRKQIDGLVWRLRTLIDRLSTLPKSCEGVEHKQPKSGPAISASSPTSVPRIRVPDDRSVGLVFSCSVLLVRLG